VRYLADGTVLVPMRNAAGELHNLQRIAPERRPMAPRKSASCPVAASRACST